MLAIREAQFPQDIAALSALDTTFETERIYRVEREEFSFRLTAEAATPPLRKCYDFQHSIPEERLNWD